MDSNITLKRMEILNNEDFKIYCLISAHNIVYMKNSLILEHIISYINKNNLSLDFKNLDSVYNFLLEDKNFIIQFDNLKQDNTLYGIFTAILVDNKVAGRIALKPLSYNKDGKIDKLTWEIFLLNDYKGMGLGYKAMVLYKDYIKGYLSSFANDCKILIGFHSNNIGTQKLQQKLGFIKENTKFIKSGYGESEIQDYEITISSFIENI
jgi:hypothetical protein